MKPEELLAHIERGRIDPVYYFPGDNDFSKNEALQKLIAAAIEPGTEDFCLDILNGEETDATTVVTLAATLPMLSERRVVVVREFQRLPQADRETVVEFAEKPNPTTCLVLITPKVDLKTKLYARLTRVATTVTFYPIFPEKIPAWIEQRARQAGKRMSPDACQTLQALVGEDLGELAGEIRKLAVYVGDRETIERADLDAVMGPSRAGTVFDLARAVGEKDFVKAHRMLYHALDTGETPHALVALLVRHITILWKIYALKHARQSDDEIKKALKLGWGFERHYPQYLAQARRLSVRDLQTGFEALLEADVALKTSRQSPRLVMQRLLYALCRGTKG